MSVHNLYGPYPDAQEVVDSQNTATTQAWISPELKRELQEKLRPYGGTLSGLIRRLLEDWARDH